MFRTIGELIKDTAKKIYDIIVATLKGFKYHVIDKVIYAITRASDKLRGRLESAKE
jgi:hypothetical protein